MTVADECRGHDIAYRPISHAETRRRRCLTIRRNAMKLKPGSRGHRKRFTMRRRPRRIMNPRLGFIMRLGLLRIVNRFLCPLEPGFSFIAFLRMVRQRRLLVSAWEMGR